MLPEIPLGQAIPSNLHVVGCLAHILVGMGFVRR